jgi:hypothetical protein
VLATAWEVLKLLIAGEIRMILVPRKVLAKAWKMDEFSHLPDLSNKYNSLTAFCVVLVFWLLSGSCARFPSLLLVVFAFVALVEYICLV